MKKHFDQALAKAESSYDEGNENVTQIIITKLKLGLAEVKKNIADFASKLEQSKVELSALMKKNLFDQSLKIKRPLKAAQFDYQSWAEFLQKTPDFFDGGIHVPSFPP